MAELTVDDVELFTGGRLSAGDDETQNALDRAYAAVRTYCGWHVSPVKTDHTVELDGPDEEILALPTKQLLTLTSVVEDGVTLNVNNLIPSVSGRLLMKQSGGFWSWKPAAITVTMTHGFENAPDFDQAVLEYVNATTMAVSAGGAGVLKRHKVDDEEREWDTALSGGQASDGLNHGLLDQYRLIPAV